jgi:hypothetical protein
MYCRVLNFMSTNGSEVRAAAIIRARTVVAARTSETSVDIQLRTRQYIPEDTELHTRRRENLKSHLTQFVCYGLLPVRYFYYIRILNQSLETLIL